MATDNSVLDRLKKLDAEREKLLDEAKSEALAAAEAAIKDLNDLGFNYRLVEAGQRAAVKESGNGRRRSGPSDQPCPICQFKTDPPHDGRAHRSQKEKKPFSPAELAEKGLTRV